MRQLKCGLKKVVTRAPPPITRIPRSLVCLEACGQRRESTHGYSSMAKSVHAQQWVWTRSSGTQRGIKGWRAATMRGQCKLCCVQCSRTPRVIGWRACEQSTHMLLHNSKPRCCMAQLLTRDVEQLHIKHDGSIGWHRWPVHEGRTGGKGGGRVHHSSIAPRTVRTPYQDHTVQDMSNAHRPAAALSGLGKARLPGMYRRRVPPTRMLARPSSRPGST